MALNPFLRREKSSVKSAFSEEKKTVSNSVTEKRRSSPKFSHRRKKEIKRQHQTHFSEERSLMHRSQSSRDQ